MIEVMAKRNSTPEPTPEPTPNSRSNTAYVGISRQQYEALQKLAEAEDRSASWMARKAVREFLERHKDD